MLQCSVTRLEFTVHFLYILHLPYFFFPKDPAAGWLVLIDSREQVTKASRARSDPRIKGRKTKGTASLPLHKPMHCFTYARLEYMQAKHVFLGLLLILYLLSSPVSSGYHGKEVWVQSRC